MHVCIVGITKVTPSTGNESHYAEWDLRPPEKCHPANCLQELYTSGWIAMTSQTLKRLREVIIIYTSF